MFLYYMIFVFCGNLKEMFREIIFINREIISFFYFMPTTIVSVSLP